ncbi:hypothetical protein HK102_006558 [Quaeritorhiza haematococci]|nr:hypothetical protein HK102_006558 [Quaeritorhiza haematococci]
MDNNKSGWISVKKGPRQTLLAPLSLQTVAAARSVRTQVSGGNKRQGRLTSFFPPVTTTKNDREPSKGWINRRGLDDGTLEKPGGNMGTPTLVTKKKENRVIVYAHRSPLAERGSLQPVYDEEVVLSKRRKIQTSQSPTHVGEDWKNDAYQCSQSTSSVNRRRPQQSTELKKHSELSESSANSDSDGDHNSLVFWKDDEFLPTSSPTEDQANTENRDICMDQTDPDGCLSFSSNRCDRFEPTRYSSSGSKRGGILVKDKQGSSDRPGKTVRFRLDEPCRAKRKRLLNESSDSDTSLSESCSESAGASASGDVTRSRYNTLSQNRSPNTRQIRRLRCSENPNPESYSTNDFAWPHATPILTMKPGTRPPSADCVDLESHARLDLTDPDLQNATFDERSALISAGAFPHSERCSMPDSESTESFTSDDIPIKYPSLEDMRPDFILDSNRFPFESAHSSASSAPPVQRRNCNSPEKISISCSPRTFDGQKSRRSQPFTHAATSYYETAGGTEPDLHNDEEHWGTRALSTFKSPSSPTLSPAATHQELPASPSSVSTCPYSPSSPSHGTSDLPNSETIPDDAISESAGSASLPLKQIPTSPFSVSMCPSSPSSPLDVAPHSLVGETIPSFGVDCFDEADDTLEYSQHKEGFEYEDEGSEDEKLGDDECGDASEPEEPRSCTETDDSVKKVGTPDRTDTLDAELEMPSPPKFPSFDMTFGGLDLSL